MAIDFYAIWNSSSTSESLLFILFILIIASCMYVFIISLRSYLLIPILHHKQERMLFLSPSQILKKSIISSYSSHNYNSYYFSKKKMFTNDPFLYPFVSVVVPARNEQGNIEKCILSLLAQNYPNFEVIVIDDNSTDDTLKIMKEIERTIVPANNRLKIISLIHKPDNWTGKTWASQQGYLQSSGSILLFTDADTYYSSKDTILLTISYMQKQNLDVLSGIPSIDLRDFWSKIIIPLWDLVSVLFGVNIADVNNTKSKVAYIMGSFFLIHKTVLEEVGTFQSVSKAVQEDRALGVRIKEAGYSMKIVRIDDMVSALWSRDLNTLWHGIGRTLAPIVIKNKFKVIKNLLIIIFMSTLPFMLLPYTLSVTIQQFTFTFMPQFFTQFDFRLILFLNIVSCIMPIIGASIKAIKQHRQTPMYAMFIFFGAIFVVLACLYNIAPLLMSNKTKSIIWRGRKYVYGREKERFVI
jgi:chlorobactene glucosyltransferase